PAGHLTDLWRPRWRRKPPRGGLDGGATAAGTQRTQPGDDSALAALVALCADLAEQLTGVGGAIVETLLQVVLVGLQDLTAAVVGFGEQLVHALGAIKATHRLFG